jgi:membrane fusion protein (multidrug efflux system)
MAFPTPNFQFILSLLLQQLIRNFPTALEGKNNVEIRSQVDGYLDRIYVEEGSYVRAGQPYSKLIQEFTANR